MADGYSKPRLTGTEKIVLIALILGIFMTSLDATIVSVAIPTMNEATIIQLGSFIGFIIGLIVTILWYTTKPAFAK